jgi:hypothetical protein
MNFPKHKCGLHLTHNEHKDYYENINEYLKDDLYDEDYFISTEDKQKCIDTDEIWILQWYPDTPVGFYRVCGSTLEIVLKKALEIENE